MRITAALLANQAEARDGLLYVNGGGWEYFAVPVFPWTVVGCIAGILELDGSERSAYPLLSMEAVASGGQVVGSSGSMIVNLSRELAPKDAPVRAPFAFPFVCAVTEPGMASVRLQTEGGVELVSISFEIQPAEPAPPNN